MEPGVFGIFRPVLLVPERIADHLTPAQLRAILAHNAESPARSRHPEGLSHSDHMRVDFDRRTVEHLEGHEERLLSRAASRNCKKVLSSDEGE